jgi:N-acetylglucosamine-6-phosphate deacetylase
MTEARTIWRGGRIFDGETLLDGHELVMEGATLRAIRPEWGDAAGEVVALEGDILCPGYVDLQVNGGGGALFNDDPSVETLRVMAEAHARLGATTIFPTLITDAPERAEAAIDAARRAVAEGVRGIGGLHLEGPHLSVARKGAHDPALIRPMTDADLARLVEAAEALPALMVTVAPENVTEAQVAALAEAGAVVSLGHTDADFETCMRYQAAGATCATHLFNAMSQLAGRAPGLVGAALVNGGLSAGLIADGIHVHPATMQAALAAKQGPGAVFLVSDAMAPAGTDQTEFALNGRRVLRRDGALRLADGTLAGADLDLTTAVGVLVAEVGLPLETALRMATGLPARLGRQPGGVGRLAVGESCALLRLSMRDGRLRLVEVRRPGD